MFQPPVASGSVDEAIVLFPPPATQSEAEGQETPRRLPRRFSASVTWEIAQAAAPPVGAAEVITTPSWPTPTQKPLAWQDMPNAFAQDKAPMLLDGSWDLTSVQKANPTMQVGSFALPGSNDPAANQPVANQDLTFEVLNKAPDKALAMKWMAFFTSPDIYKQYVNMTGISPIMKSGGPYSSFSSKVLGSLFGQGFNPGDILPALSADQGFSDTATQWPLASIER